MFFCTIKTVENIIYFSGYNITYYLKISKIDKTLGKKDPILV